MSELRILSIPEQIANYLRGELANGRWSGALPGRFELARQLGVGISSMEEALRQLERDGVLASQGAGRMREINVRRGWKAADASHGCLRAATPSAQATHYPVV